MRGTSTIAVVIPALNEQGSIANVLDAIPSWVDQVIVADNGSVDGTAAVATAHGARVVYEGRRGYGAACLAGIAVLSDPDVVVFLDADFSDYPGEMALLVDPVLDGKADMVIGSRLRGALARGALTPQARFGNWLACALMRLFWGVRYTDLGPFRAIRFRALEALDMRDRDYGWTVEMQVKAAQRGVKAIEVPVSYRKRIGRSKVSGTVRGVIGAGTKILLTIFRSALQRRACPSLLVIFTRYPEAGRTKTRLVPALGREGAAELHRQMAEYTLSSAERFVDTCDVAVEVRFTGAGRRQMRAWLGRDVACRPQDEGDLGARMRRTFEDAFRAGAKRVVIIGTDCPEISPELLGEAFDALRQSDLVLGPAMDGGYYLIGLRHSVAPGVTSRIFESMPWGTERILECTLALASEVGLDVTQLAVLADVDRPEDLEVWRRVRPNSSP